MKIIDIHCHILHDIDDGAESISEAKEMLECAQQQGITQIIATPHYSSNIAAIYDLRFKELTLLAKNYNIKIHKGCEYDISYLSSSKFDSKILNIIDHQFVLIDFVNNLVTDNHIQSIYNLKIQGYSVVIAHPERLFSNKDIDVLEQLREEGCYFQINASSIIKLRGKKSFLFAKNLLENGMCHLIASDAHNNNRRKINMQSAYQKIKKFYGIDIANKLFFDNPKLLIENKQLHQIIIKKTFFQKIIDLF